MNTFWFVIINPTSGNGKSKKNIPKILFLLNKNDVAFKHVITTQANHEFELVQNAIKSGFRKIVSIGGDGTLHNIINGIMHQKEVDSSKIKIAVIPVGTGNDWVKTYGITTNINSCLSIIKEENTIYQDIGKINLTKNNSVIYFNNLAGIGFDGYVVNLINKYKKLGSLSYLIGALIGFSTYKPIELEIVFNSKKIKVVTLMTLIGLCKYSGGGMQLTKNSNPTDGLLDITIIKNLGLGLVLLNILNLFNGKIVDHKKVNTYKTSEINVSILGNTTAFIQADGELINSSNFNITLIPKAIQIIVPK